MLVLVIAVTLSPMVMVMGLRSLASTVFGLSEVVITGVKGSVQNHLSIGLRQRLCYKVLHSCKSQLTLNYFLICYINYYRRCFLNLLVQSTLALRTPAITDTRYNFQIQIPSESYRGLTGNASRYYELSLLLNYRHFCGSKITIFFIVLTLDKAVTINFACSITVHNLSKHNSKDF